MKLQDSPDIEEVFKQFRMAMRGKLSVMEAIHIEDTVIEALGFEGFSRIKPRNKAVVFKGIQELIDQGKIAIKDSAFDCNDLIIPFKG